MIQTGRILNDHQARVLKRNISRKEMTSIANELGNISGSTIRDVIYQNNPITENSLPAIMKAFKRAGQNAVRDTQIKHEDKDYIIDELGMSKDEFLAELQEFHQDLEIIE